MHHLFGAVKERRILREIDRVLSHARQRILERQSAGAALLGLIRELARDRAHLTRIPVRSEGRVKVIDLADADWISAADNYVTLHVRPVEEHFGRRL